MICIFRFEQEKRWRLGRRFSLIGGRAPTGRRGPQPHPGCEVFGPVGAASPKADVPYSVVECGRLDSLLSWVEGGGDPSPQGDRPVAPTGGRWTEGKGLGQGEDEGCQRSLCGLGRDVGDHPRRNAAGIRFYADEGEAGNHPRRNAAGIHGRGASSLGV